MPKYGPIKSYRFVGRHTRVHRLRAEQALGHPLPPKAEVHHVDLTKSEFSPLVICQDNAYHTLLHARTRIVRAGGNPNADRMCSQCKKPVPIPLMATRKSGIHNVCKRCIADNVNKRYHSLTPEQKREYCQKTKERRKLRMERLRATA